MWRTWRSGTITPLTNDGAFRMINGTFDWAYEEEFSCRDGFRWSPDSKSIAYWQIDATGIRNFLLIDNTDSLYSFTIPVEYPKAGEDPSACRVGVVSLATGQRPTLDAGAGRQPAALYPKDGMGGQQQRAGAGAA